MTEDNRKAAASADRQRAEECYNEAKMLLDAGFAYGASSRAYYAVFHAARALLFSMGFEVRSHRAVVSMLGEHFIKAGKLPAHVGRLVSRLQRDREDADYVVGAVFTVAEAKAVLDDARTGMDALLKALDETLPR